MIGPRAAMRSGPAAARHRVLCIEDDPVIQLMLNDIVGNVGADCTLVGSARDAEHRLTQGKYDLVILDRRLPDSDGLLLMQTIKENSNCPVVVLSSMDETRDKLLGIGLGAAEYLTKPINPLELGSRIKHLLAPEDASQDPEQALVYEGDDYVFNALTRQLSSRTNTIFLAPAEARLLHRLLLTEGDVQTRDELSQFACGRDWTPGDRTVDVLVNRLRGHLSKTSIEIVTVHRSGYLAVANGRAP